MKPTNAPSESTKTKSPVEETKVVKTGKESLSPTPGNFGLERTRHLKHREHTARRLDAVSDYASFGSPTAQQQLPFALAFVAAALAIAYVIRRVKATPGQVSGK